MWELISQNKRRSVVLFIAMGAILLTLGYIIGAAYAPPDGGAFGVVLAGMIWMIMSSISYFSGDSVMLSIAGAKEITREIHPQLFNVVEEMKIAGSLPKVPKVYIIDTPAPNAFATGRKPENASIAVTSGLVAKMNRDELQGVVAHETGHILNRDILFITFAGVMLGTIVIIAEMFLRGLRFGGSRRYSSSRSKSGGQGAAILMIVALVFAILAPIMAQLLYYAISRRREYLADATAVRLTRYPEGLASALEKIAGSTEDMPQMNKAIAPLFIANPLKQEGSKLSDLTATHPPISERIRILRSIAGGSGYLNYQQAYSLVKGKSAVILPGSATAEKDAPPIRAASTDSDRAEYKPPTKRDVGDLLRAANGFLFMTCTCGLKMKVPPEFEKDSITCPRCGTVNKVPIAELTAASAVLEGIGQQNAAAIGTESAPAQQTYERQSKGWESFRCSCGQGIQLSPAFAGDRVTCPKCSKVTLIK